MSESRSHYFVQSRSQARGISLRDRAGRPRGRGEVSALRNVGNPLLYCTLVCEIEQLSLPLLKYI